MSSPNTRHDSTTHTYHLSHILNRHHHHHHHCTVCSVREPTLTGRGGFLFFASGEAVLKLSIFPLHTITSSTFPSGFSNGGGFKFISKCVILMLVEAYAVMRLPYGVTRRTTTETFRTSCASFPCILYGPALGMGLGGLKQSGILFLLVFQMLGRREMFMGMFERAPCNNIVSRD
ncbi:hypothetical protein N431DRAFT_85834 [Stipitochalara longipes BDJ]|nr:hypothetical protein N431DRAFT_85834 [Stipitochalara longipes BDJ]